ncbi:3-methyladenine DNA glycosylase [Akkermansiaceae bacterium]|nr:3-methyladenine DNA glycosylase [Akkermansiaceae bacterium]
MGLEILRTDEWEAIASTHLAAACVFTGAARLRRDRGRRHPVEDFLFDYYPYKFALLEQWHPGLGVALEFQDRESLPERFRGNAYRIHGNLCFADPARLSDKESGRLQWIAGLLRATQSHAPNFACHGLHEWAMVYRAEEIRHASLAPLRLPQAEIDALIESRPVACTHHDAFRFFAKQARPFNRIQPSLETRHENEQPGCVHANMDLYKWAAKSMPWIGSSLLLESFRLASELRDLDMRASPYDLSAWGVVPVKIETPEGRRQYEWEQRRHAAAAAELRARLIHAIEGALPSSDRVPAKLLP